MAYASVTVEGGLFPADLLDRIAAGQAEGQHAADFRVNGTRRLADEIQSAFSDARSFWDAFQRRLQRSRESKTTLTREDWMVPALELLGFDRLIGQRASAEADRETFFISHRAGEDAAAPPVHIVSIDDKLDQRSGAGRRSPHSVVQDYLNRSDALWGITTNGKRLRLLRDTVRLAKPTYLEFDLEGMVEGNLYSEFVLLYRLVHASRFPRDGASPHECLLERYYQQGIDEGGRARDKLRDGVEEALKVLGTAFLAHPDSGALRARVAAGGLDAEGYYRQLLRLVYRLLFLMVAEERRLLFPAEESDLTLHAVYKKYYSVSRLRERCERYFAGDTHTDLWQGLVTTFKLFRDDDLARKLGLRALDGELFNQPACADLESASCTNEQLLRALWHLSMFEEDMPGRRRRSRGQRRRVNYGDINVEEFGSVYESLLEYRPHVSLEPPAFDFRAGSERKQTGSYYTPPELVRELIESALVPVMEERLSKAKTKEEKEQTLLSLRVCDPASGSGHFLLAAARRIARELAKARTGEEEPTPEAYRVAVRDVIRNCVYAVDKNPLAVDLCKVALWIEGHNAGLPLSFLDHHVKCGDSLVGVFDLDVLLRGIPDEAYKPVTGDDKAVARGVRDRNRRERQGQLGLAAIDLEGAPAELAQQFAELARREERAPDDVHAKEQLYERLRAQGSEWWKYKVACDLWTAAFFTPLRSTDGPQPDLVPTTDTVRRFLGQPDAAHGQVVGHAMGLSQEQHFFHWPLEFPEVFAQGGFDAVLGNPPFMGGKRISTNLGDRYRTFLQFAYPPGGNTTDLSAFFYRRAFQCLQVLGHLGMVATNSIGQGDTREAGLAQILREGGTIVSARRFVAWPGAASVEVNLVGIRRGEWPKPSLLDGQPVGFVSSRLDDVPEREAERLHQNEAKAFIGSYVRGIGFVLQADDARRLLVKDPRNCDCLFPYLTGEDLNGRPDQSPSRWVINFFDWPRERASKYHELFEIVERKVLPERQKIRQEASRKKNVTYFWRYDAMGRELYQTVDGLQRVLARSEVGELHMVTFVPSGLVYSHMLVVFAFDDAYHFSLVQSSIHEAWVRRNASTMRTDIRYTPTDCFRTFPFPQDPATDQREWAGRLGGQYHEHRRQVMLTRNLGLTKTYNLFHSPECQDEDIVRLREQHAAMDRAILACYGWQDLDPGHGFYQNERGQTRYTVSPEARREILRRLLDLNLEVAERERNESAVRTAARRARRSR